MSIRLQVWHHRTQVGTLKLNAEGRWSFEYAPDWKGFALSPHLPIAKSQDDLAHQRTVEWFFDNLLPEGTLRQALAKRQGVHEKDTWQLLSFFGRDTAGALSVLPEGAIPSDQQSYFPLSADRLARMIEQSREGIPLMAQDGALRMSLAGAQEKIAIRLKSDGSFWLAEGASPSTHILKPENANEIYPFCPANEWFCLSLAAALGLKAPAVHLLHAGEHRVYIIDRYDREESAGEIRRLHQIDLCQACNVPPSRKYEDENGLSAAELFSMTGHCRVPAVAKNAAMHWLAFNYLIGNSDAHAKNISFLMTGKKPEIAPAYDLLCVDAYHHDYRLTMSIGGMHHAGWVEGCHWDAFALQNHVDPRAMRMVLKRLSGELIAAAEVLLLSPLLTSAERDWLRGNVMSVLKERQGFAKSALAEAICRDVRALQAKRGVVPDAIIDAIQ